MYLSKATIGTTAGANGGSGFASAWYWSSSEYSIGGAWNQHFGSGYQVADSKNVTYYVRAIRAF